MKKSTRNIIRNFCFASSVFIVAGCNTRYLEEGQMLYTGAKIEIESDTLSKAERTELKDGIESRLTPKPNSSFLGLRPKLWIYNITKPPKDSAKTSGLRYWLKNKVGEEPVLLEEVDRDFNRDIIVNYSENKGYFNAKARYDTVAKNKKAEVHYTLTPKQRYYISNVSFEQDSAVISQEINQVADKTFLKTGDPFDLDVIKAERERIDNALKERGFYYFHADNIIVQADSTVTDDPRVELNVKLKNSTPQLAKEQFTIDKTVVYPDYSLQTVRNHNFEVPTIEDTLANYVFDDLYIVDPERNFKPKMFDRVFQFERGDLYNRADHNMTLNRLISLGVFKFVKNEFIVSDSLNNKFDAYYLLTPREFQSLRVEALGRSNSANYAGSELNLNWTHRNIFKGAEQLKVSAYGSFDWQVGGPRNENEEKGTGNIFRAGANAQLSIPRIVAPFRFRSSSAFVPRTNASIGYEFLSRTKWYTLHNFNASFGYQWKENVRKEHDLKIFDATLVAPAKVTPLYDSLAAGKPYLQRVVEKQLIFGPTYTYTYTNTMLPRTNTIYYRGLLDLSANITGLLTGANVKKGNQKEIFDIPFSQYAKMEHDFRFYHKLTDKQTIATRVIAGLAYPYGNSEYIPFSRQFFAGGSNSVRAFRARNLGPGSFDPRTQQSFFFDQAGDVRLELNAEYRAHLMRFLNVAVFADAGNVWLVNEDPDRPGGKFSKDWLSEVAIGAGVGLRLDFNILILRLDLATPLRVPYYEKGDRWTFNKFDIGSGSWRRDNLILNIAIGYPF